MGFKDKYSYYLNNNKKSDTISDALKCSVSTVKRFKRKVVQYLKEPFPTKIETILKDLPRSGRPPTITLKMKEKILETSCKPPKEFNLPGQVWTLRR